MDELFDATSYRYALRIDRHYGPDFPDYWEGQMAIFHGLETLERWLTEHGFVNNGYGYILQSADQNTLISASVLVIPYVEG